MKLDTLIEGGSAECKNHDSVTSIYGVTSLFNFLQLKACLEHNSKTIEGN